MHNANNSKRGYQCHVTSGAEKVETFHVTKDGTLLGRSTSEALRLVSFAKQIRKDERALPRGREPHKGRRENWDLKQLMN